MSEDRSERFIDDSEGLIINGVTVEKEDNEDEDSE